VAFAVKFLETGLEIGGPTTRSALPRHGIRTEAQDDDS
jgi:hypothetical protein